MGCNRGKFWIGLGVGSILGAVAYRLAQTKKARELEDKVYDAICNLRCKAEEALEDAEDQAMNMRSSAMAKGADLAGKVAQKADKIAQRADEIAKANK